MTVLCDAPDHRAPARGLPAIDRESPGSPGASARSSGRRRRSRGFTLVELLVVLTILGLLAVMVGPQVMKYLGSAKHDAAAIQVERLSGVLDLYRLDVGDYPEGGTGLEALLTKPAGAERWNGPYVKKAEQLIDPWGNPYIYQYPGEHGEFDLYSFGKDGREGGEGEAADVTSW